MCSIGVDVAQGGDDDTTLARRHDGWFDKIIVVPGKQTPDGASVAGLVVAHRRNGAEVVIDLGGGYGGAAYEWLTDQGGIKVHAYKGAEGGPGRTIEGKLTFSNRRSRAYWRFREALDPGQPGGSPIMLPPDPALVADLTSPTFKVGPNGIQLESKESIVKRLGRSPDKGDAVVMAWEQGLKTPSVQGGFKRRSSQNTPQVVLGHQSTRRNTPTPSRGGGNGGEHG